MSNINQVYSTLRTIIPLITGMTSKKELTCPESLRDNNSNILKDGWGIVVGPSNHFSGQELCRTMDQVSFSIVVTKEAFNSIADPSKAFTVNDELLTNLSNIRVRLLDSDKLGIPQYLDMVEFNGASGIEFVNSEKYNIRSITINFNFLITEALS
jgi:hypothetical protein